MKHARNAWLQLLRALCLLTLGSIWAVACGGPQEQGGPGAVCFRTDDCKDGLACVPTAKGSSKSVCGADLSGIVFMVDGAPLEAAAPLGDAAGGASGGVSGAASGGSAAGKAAAAAGGGGGKPATGGATGMAGSGSAGKSSGGAPAGGAAAGTAGTAGSGTAGSSSGGGTAGSEPADAGDG